MELLKTQEKQHLMPYIKAFTTIFLFLGITVSAHGFYEEEEDGNPLYDEIIQESEEGDQEVVRPKKPSLTIEQHRKLPPVSPSTQNFSTHQTEEISPQDIMRGDDQIFPGIEEEIGLPATILRGTLVGNEARLTMQKFAVGHVSKDDSVRALAFSNDDTWIKIGFMNYQGKKMSGWIIDDRVEVHGIYGPSEISPEERRKLDRKTKNRRWTMAQAAKKSLPREYGRKKEPNCFFNPPASRQAGVPHQLKEVPYAVTVYEGSFYTREYETTCRTVFKLSKGDWFIYLGWHNSESYVAVLKKTGRINYGWIQENGVSDWKNIFGVPDDSPEFWKKAIEGFPTESQHVVTKDTGFVLLKGAMPHLNTRGVLRKGAVVNKHAEQNDIVLVSFKYSGYGNFYTWFEKKKFLKLGQWEANVAAKTEERKGLFLWIVIASIIYFILVLGTRIGRYAIDWFGYFIFKEGRPWKFIILLLSMIFLWITASRLYRGVFWEEGVTATDSTSMFTVLSVPFILLLPFFLYITWIWVKMLFTPLTAAIQADKVIEHGRDAAYASHIFDESKDGKYWADKARRHHTGTIAAIFKARKQSFKQSMQNVEDQHREKMRKKL